MSEFFLTDGILSGRDWRGLERAIVRALLHSGWQNVQYVGETGDKGADVLAVREYGSGEKISYLVQVKAVIAGRYVGVAAIDQAIRGQAYYKARRVIVATNGDFTNSVYARVKELANEGFDVRLWNGRFLRDFLNHSPKHSVARKPLRPYQERIVERVLDRFSRDMKRSLYVVATGLGKTVIAATIVDRLLEMQKVHRVLVLCHTTDLAHQLEEAFWTQLNKSIPTRLFMAGEPPTPFLGVSIGLYQTLYNYLSGLDKDFFDLIIVDEAHHALANAFMTSINHFEPRHLIGMTATPWRGDGSSIESVFGEPIDTVSLIDGMRMGYLAKVDYRIMCDNLNWDEVSRLSGKSVSVRDLNKRLFLPQRDDAVIAEIVSLAESFPDPRILVFSPSVVHAEEFSKKLLASGIAAANVSIDDKVARRRTLLRFASGELIALTAVDVLNEGIDVPEVNVLVFLRATHSRRIFIQQLGRGLRLSRKKSEVIVLDFVSDIRRLAAVGALDREARSGGRNQEIEVVYLRDGVVTFQNEKSRKFVNAWLEDVAELEDQDDAHKLSFPAMDV